LEAGDSYDQAGEGAVAYADSVAVYLLGILTSRILDRHSSAASWDASRSKEQARGVFARQAISMVWDYAESNSFGTSSGNLGESAAWVCDVIARPAYQRAGWGSQVSAGNRAYQGLLVSTDPPYYDNVGYADLSDFFYVWLRRSLGAVLPSGLGTMLTPKSDELVADPFRRGGVKAADDYFERGFVEVFARIRRDTPHDFPITVFYARKQSEVESGDITSTGWEVLLEGMIRSGWEITATWPIRTELGNRMRSIDSNALASSIVLACRPRDDGAPSTTRRAQGRATAGPQEVAAGIRRPRRPGPSGDRSRNGHLLALCEGRRGRWDRHDHPHRPGADQPRA
jgi:putative DNA methylase